MRPARRDFVFLCGRHQCPCMAMIGSVIFSAEMGLKVSVLAGNCVSCSVNNSSFCDVF